MDKAKFYLNARGSIYELIKSHLMIARELGFIEDKAADGVFEIIEKLSLKMNNLINKMRNLKGIDWGAKV